MYWRAGKRAQQLELAVRSRDLNLIPRKERTESTKLSFCFHTGALARVPTLRHL